MRLTPRLAVSAATLCIGLALLPAPSRADITDPLVKKTVNHGTGVIALQAASPPVSRHSAGTGRSGPASPSATTRTSGGGKSAGYKKAEATYNASVRRYQGYVTAQSAYAHCVAEGGSPGCVRPAAVGAPGDFSYVEQNGRIILPTLTPEQAAYVAYARLRIVPPKPMIGPPPEINEWKMAAVGYPMWLWAEGNLNPAPVSDTVYDLTVRLDARLVGVTFDMGDGHRMTCTNVSDAWVRGIAPAAPSPSCGYTYTKPSLPRGTYTITAHSEWAVDWSVNGVGGTIPLYQEASTQLPVGELQVLVR